MVRSQHQYYVLAKVLCENNADVVADGSASNECDATVGNCCGSDRWQYLKLALQDNRRVRRQDWLGREPAECDGKGARLHIRIPASQQARRRTSYLTV